MWGRRLKDAVSGSVPVPIALGLFFLSVSSKADDEEDLMGRIPNRPELLASFLKQHHPAQWILDKALAIVTNEDDLPSAKLLLDAGANADSHGYWPHDEFPLQHAAYTGDAALVRLLLERGANPNRRDTYGWTAFFLAAIHERFEAAEVLAHWKGCRHCLRGNHGETALHMAVSRRKPEAVKYLLNHTRVQKDVKDDRGETALDYARRELQNAEREEKAEWRRIIKLLQ